MTDVKKHQELTVSLMDHTAFGTNLEVPYMDDGATGETCNLSEELGVPREAENLRNEIDAFIPVVRRYLKNIDGREFPANGEKRFHHILPLWNTFLQPAQGIRDTAIISLDINEDMNKFVLLADAHWIETNKKWIKRWFPQWNMFLQARAGETLVTRWNLILTVVGFLFYIVDMVSDIGTSMYYASNGQWWRSMATLTIVYGAIIMHTVLKWTNGQIHCTSVADWLRYVGSLLVNWPEVKQYGALCLLELQLHKSPASSARLVPEWHVRRVNVARLKFTEGVWEACPQAILQLCLLVSDLYGEWTWTDYLRIAGASVSLCTAGAALVNWEKLARISNYLDVPLSELIVLHVWTVPVTVSRLMSVTLILSVHPYWTLAGVALHLVLPGVYYCRTDGNPRSLGDVVVICLTTLQFFVSPFDVVWSTMHRRMRHAVHFLVNTVAMVVWALGTPLVYAHPALYTAIMCFNAVMFAVGLVGWQVHENCWPDSYRER